MSSGFATIPKTAPFAEEEIDLLNRVVGPANALQRAWLAGFLAGVESVSGVAQPAAPARPAEPITIVYASESGNCEKLAGDFAKAARKNGLKPTLIDMADLDLAALASAKRLVVIAATWGEGEPPARAVRTYGELMGEGAPRLDGVEFGVLALGDAAYGLPDEYVGEEGTNWLDHWAITRGHPPRNTPVFPQWVIDRSNALALPHGAAASPQP